MTRDPIPYVVRVLQLLDPDSARRPCEILALLDRLGFPFHNDLPHTCRERLLNNRLWKEAHESPHPQLQHLGCGRYAPTPATPQTWR